MVQRRAPPRRGFRDEYRLTAEHWQAISAAIPSRMKTRTNWPKLEPIVRADLDEAIVLFRTLSSRRQHYPITAERRRWNYIGDLTERLITRLRMLRDLKPPSDDDPDWLTEALIALQRVMHRVGDVSAFHDTWRAFRGRKNPYREFLYHDVLRVWTRRLKGRLENYWVSEQGEPRGPLVEFFIACIEPVLGAKTPRAGIVDIIERERKHRVRRLLTDINLGPAVAAIGTVEQYPDITLESGARGNPQFARRARHLTNVTAVNLPFGIERLERHMPPVIAAIGTLEHARTAYTVDGIRPPAAGQHAVHIDGIIIHVLAVTEVLPVLTPIDRAQRATHFDSGVDELGLGGAGVQHQDSLCRIGTRRRRDFRETHTDR